MPTATVTNVYPKGPTKSGKNGPGAVVFSDGVKLPTFSDADLTTAKGLIGQLAEYTAETKGQYTNLGSVRAAANSAPAPVPARTLTTTSPDASVLVAAIRDHAAAIRELAVEYRKVAAGILSPSGAAVAEPVSSVDVVAEAQKELAAEVGEDAAEAQFSAIRKRHKKPEALIAAAKGLLRAHGIGEAA